MRLAIVEVRSASCAPARLLIRCRPEDGRRSRIRAAARTRADRVTGQLILYNSSGRITGRVPLERVLRIDMQAAPRSAEPPRA